MRNQIELKINELAEKVVPPSHIESFISLPLEDKVFGVKFFATLLNDNEIVEMCDYALNQI